MDSSSSVTEKNWAGLGYEDLVHLVQQKALPQVWEEVRRRTEEWLPPFAAKVARAAGLREADIPDAQQQAALAIQETLRRLAQPRAEGRKVSHPLTFLHRVVKSRIWDFVKKVGRAEGYYDRSRDAVAALEGGGDRRRPNKEAEPLKQLIRQEDRERLRRAVARLSAMARQVVQGRLEDKTFAEIAQEMGKSEATVWRLWEKALKRLRAQLADLADGDAE